MNPGGETHKPKLGLNPQTCDSLGEGHFPFVSLFFICAEQEHESLILDFHWKSIPTYLSYYSEL